VMDDESGDVKMVIWLKCGGKKWKRGEDEA